MTELKAFVIKLIAEVSNVPEVEVDDDAATKVASYLAMNEYKVEEIVRGDGVDLDDIELLYDFARIVRDEEW